MTIQLGDFSVSKHGCRWEIILTKVYCTDLKSSEPQKTVNT